MIIPDKVISIGYAEEKGYSFIKSDQSFDSVVEELKAHVIERNEVIKSYLKN